jgi:hypothetical protein
MNNQQIWQIIRYIKVREAWREALWTKSNSLSSIWNGLFRLGFFLIHYSMEKYFFQKQTVEFLKHTPNYKYFLYFSLVYGLWGLFDIISETFKYFSAKEEAERIKRRVEELEKVL